MSEQYNPSRQIDLPRPGGSLNAAEFNFKMGGGATPNEQEEY